MIESIHPHGYWIGETASSLDKGLCDVLVDVFRASGGSVLDLGCGCCGHYVNALRAVGIPCNGYDGCPDTERMSRGVCGVADLAKPLVGVPVHDWVLCLEVGEHLPQEFEATLVESIHAHNRQGVVLSWAVEGQIGHGHVNCRNNDYIKGIFKNLGYHDDVGTQEKMRRSVTSCPWFRGTAMIFRR